MALDFSFGDINKYFGELKKDTNDFFDSTSKKLTNSLENQKNEFIDFTKELKSNTKELIDTTVDKVDKKFDSLSDTASQKAKEISTLVEKFIDEIPEKTSAAISNAGTKINEFKTDAKEWIETNVTWENTKAVIVTGLASFVEGFIDIGEGVVDAHIYTVSIIVELLSKAGVNVDNTKLNDIIAYDVSAKMYDAIIDKSGVNKDIAYGGLRKAGNFAGEMVGYYALSSVPYVGKALSILGGVGNSVEQNINDQMEQTGAVNEGKLFLASILGALEGFSFGKMTQGASKGIGALKEGFKALKPLGKEGIKELGKQAIGNLGKGTTKEIIKNNLGKIFKHTTLSTFSDSDTYTDTAAALANNIYSYAETGEMDWGRLILEAGGSFVLNFVTHLGDGYTGALGDLLKKTDLDVKDSVTVLESDQSLSIKDNTSNISFYNEIGDVKNYNPEIESIKQKFCKAFNLDYSDGDSRKMVNGIMDLIEKNEFTDSSVKYLYENFDKLKDINPNLSIKSWDSGSLFWRPVSQLGMNINDLDSSKMIFSHELGHLSYDTIMGTSENLWEPIINSNSVDALNTARKNIEQNKERVADILKKCSDNERESFKLTEEWYEGVKEIEYKKVADYVEDLYNSNTGLDELRESLKKAGISDLDIESMLANKKEVISTLQNQNGVNIQVAYYGKLNGSYDTVFGNSRKISSIIDSITQSSDDFQFSFGHKKGYWKNDSLSYNELLADYVSLSANGRSEVISLLEDLCGKEIFDDIRKTLNDMVTKIGG